MVVHLFFIVLTFTLPFYFLMMYHDAFSTLAQSFLTTTVWLIGDLNYAYAFLNEDSPVLYPIQANILFLVFVIVVGGLVFNMILRNPSEELNAVKNKADFLRAQLKFELLLFIDDCFPFICRKYAKAQIKLPCPPRKIDTQMHKQRESNEETEKHLSEIKEELQCILKDVGELSRQMEEIKTSMSPLQTC